MHEFENQAASALPPTGQRVRVQANARSEASVKGVEMLQDGFGQTVLGSAPEHVGGPGN